MKYFFVIVLLCYVARTDAQNGSLNLALPSAPGSFQSDRFRAGDLDCSMAIGSGTNIEFGVVGIINNNQSIITNNAQGGKDVGVYGRITIPIGAPKGRVDCNTLYQLELNKRRMEIQKLEAELNNLKTLQFENKK
jgi:hypothetical protein